MRLNLPAYNCHQFVLDSEFVVPASYDAAIDQIMNQTATHIHGFEDGYEEEMRVAVFGSRFTIDGRLFQSRASLSKTKQGDDTGLELRFVSNPAPEGLSRPSRQVRSVTMLVDSIAGLFGAAEVSCDARFEYDASSSMRSGLSLPIPLLAPVVPEGVTHIENAEFSRRDDHGIQYRIVVLNVGDSGALVHAVHFESEIVLNRGSIRQLLNRAHAISNQLLIPKGDDRYA